MDGGRGGHVGSVHRGRRACIRSIDRRVEGPGVLTVMWRHGASTAIPNLIPQNPTDRTHRGHIVLVAHTVRQQLVADLPGEYTRVAFLVHFDMLHYIWGGDPGLGPPDGSR